MDRETFAEHMVGKSIVRVEPDTGEMWLSDGTTLVFDKFNDECCTSIELVDMLAVPHMIMAAGVGDDETAGMGEYKAWVWVLTQAGQFRVVEADGDAGNGYYLHGFALGVRVYGPDGQEVETKWMG